MKERSKELGFTNIEFHCCALQSYFSENALPKNETQTFDKVLLDVPCSGTGVMSKRADLRWNRTEHDLIDLTTLQVSFPVLLLRLQSQEELMGKAAQLVKPGGLLVYSTCSIEFEENQERVQSFLRSHPHFKIERPPKSRSIANTAMECISEDGFLIVFPFEYDMDGSFSVRLRSIV